MDKKNVKKWLSNKKTIYAILFLLVWLLLWAIGWALAGS